MKGEVGIRIKAVHGVASLVREREHVVHRAVPVHQDDGRRGVGARRIRARAFPLRLVNIHPASRKTGPQVVDVVLPQETEPAEHQIDALPIVMLLFRFGGQGHHKVIRRQLVKTQHLPTQLQVAFQEGPRRTNRADERVVDRGRHVVPEQRRFSGRGVVSHAGLKRVAPHRRAVQKPPACAGDPDRPS